jgi:hypothetical protein
LAPAGHLKFSSGDIPAISFVIAVITLVRCLQKMNSSQRSCPVGPDFRLFRSKARGTVPFAALLQIIRNWKKERRDAVKWHRLVTCAQHKAP